MIVLTPDLTAQEIRFIPRVYEADSIIFHDENENSDTTIEGLFSKDDYYLVTNMELNLVNGRFYTITVMNGTSVIYKDRVFCTDQEITDYSINSGIYTENTTTNKYITV